MSSNLKVSELKYRERDQKNYENAFLKEMFHCVRLPLKKDLDFFKYQLHSFRII